MATQPRLTAPLAALLLLLPWLAGCGDTLSGQALRGILPRLDLQAEAEPDEPAPPHAAGADALQLLAPRRDTLLPVSRTGDNRLWRGRGRLALATDGPRIVATAGLPQMVMATRFDGPDPLDDPRALVGQPARLRRTVDLAGADRDPRSMRFGLTLDCTLRGHVEGDWILVQERCAGGGISFTNRFWAEAATGEVRRSEQWAGDAVPMLVVQGDLAGG